MKAGRCSLLVYFLPEASRSRPLGYKTNGWHSATVPTTVVAALVADKTYPDPYYGKNLRDIPGTTYPIGKNFSLLSMPQGQSFPLRLVVSDRIHAACDLQGPARLVVLRRD